MKRELGTLVGVLRERARERPRHRAYAFLPRGDREDVVFDYAELDLRARAIAAWLSSRSKSGDRVLILSPSGPEFVASVFGCLYRGAVAVPAYPIDPLRMERTASRLLGIIRDAEPALALTTAASLGSVKELIRSYPELNEVQWVAAESISLDLAEDWKQPAIDADTLAILQYTSGSSAAPRGVMVSHRNILENEKIIQEAHGYSETTTFVGWIPLAHDWGLIQ